MKLGDFFDSVDDKNKNYDIRGIAFDVSEVKNDYLFFALKGKIAQLLIRKLGSFIRLW